MTAPRVEYPLHFGYQVFVEYLARTRWFGGKGRDYAVTGVRRIGTLGEHDQVDVLLVEVSYADGGGEVELYQVPLSYYTDPEHRLDHAFIGWWEDPERGWVHAYDALHDREATKLWLTAFGGPGEATSVGGLDFRRVPGHDLDTEAVGALFTGEQSNSSVAFGEDSVLKLFRKITPGANPDITTHEVLTRVGSEHVAQLYGWVEQVGGGDDDVLHLGMLQQFLRTATDGWELALASIRNLFADETLTAREAGGDFAGESARLGEALRDVHDVLRRELPVDAARTPTPRAIADAMAARLDAALLVVPGLEQHADRLRRAYAALGDLPTVPVQQVHGDLHLGQTLRTSLGWKIVDFEGEPAKPLADRLLPDSPWRDVAGMLRSFDYAPHVVERDHELDDGDRVVAMRARGEEWAQRNQRYFLAAYAGGDLTPEQNLLVHAYLADKAVYEAIYETRNRPSWVDIPLAGLSRI